MSGQRATVLALRLAPFVLFALIARGFRLASERFLSLRSFDNIVEQAAFVGIVATAVASERRTRS